MGPAPGAGTSSQEAAFEASLERVMTRLLDVKLAPINQQLASFGGEVKAVNGKLDTLVGELATQRERIDAQDVRITAIEGQLAQMQGQINRVIQGGGGGGVAVAGPGEEHDFQPRFVEIEGWCEWKDRARDGVTRLEADEHVRAIRTIAPEDLKQEVGGVSVFGYRNHRIRVAVASGRARGFRDWLMEAYNTAIIEPVKGTKDTAKVKVERSPAQKANLAVFLRGLRAAEQHLQERTGAEGPGPKVWPNFATWSVMVGDNQVLAKLPRGATELTWQEEGLRAVGAVSGAALLAKARDR